MNLQELKSKNPEELLKQADKSERGTEIILNIAEDAIDYLEESKIQSLLNKYCKFLPVEIKFGTKTKKEKNEKQERRWLWMCCSTYRRSSQKDETHS